ncbi:MAG TPA: hypothetical protein VNW97_01275 [Candidatus Saccharimonadales bacterium]|jgi:hypothetical protein|nr:hypothetical protein [Candidatus Saccharimonadales bacterium]
MNRPSRIIVLAEDQPHQRFVRHYLMRLGYKNHEIQNEDLPSGRGCGEQWVRTRYAKNVLAFRKRAVRVETALVVVIDADNNDVDKRVQQFRQALIESGLEPRSNNEKITHLIPKRSIETWILCLTGAAVNEDTDYSHQHQLEQQIKPASEKLFEWSRPNAGVPAHCVPSLRSAIPEVRRLE